jgi:hypothetical protein
MAFRQTFDRLNNEFRPSSPCALRNCTLSKPNRPSPRRRYGSMSSLCRWIQHLLLPVLDKSDYIAAMQDFKYKSTIPHESGPTNILKQSPPAKPQPGKFSPLRSLTGRTQSDILSNSTLVSNPTLPIFLVREFLPHSIHGRHNNR